MLFANADLTVPILAASAIAGFLAVFVASLTLILYLKERRSDDKDKARDEALALSDTRGQRIDDLTKEIDRLTKARHDDAELHDQQIRKLRDEMGVLEARFSSASREFTAAQTLTARAVIDLVIDVTALLEEQPPAVQAALSLLRAYTSGRASEAADTPRT